MNILRNGGTRIREYEGKKTSDKERPVKNYYLILFHSKLGGGGGGGKGTPLGQVDRKETVAVASHRY